MKPQKSLYPNPEEEERLRKLYPDIGSVRALDPHAPRQIRNPEPTEEEKRRFIAECEAS